MASRAKQKEEARAQRLAAEQAAADRGRRQRRLRMLAGIALAAIAVVVVAVVVAVSSNSSSGIKTGTEAQKVQNDVNQLLSGIPQSGSTLGSPSAPVTMVYYGDLECPICRDFTLQGGFQPLVQNEVRNGKVKVVYKAFQTATRDPNTFKTQQVAALAAGRQKHFWDFTELFYRQQGQEGTPYVTEAFLTGLAKQIIPPLNMTQWRKDRTDPALASQVTSEVQEGTAAGVQGTPTLIMEGPKGKAQLPEAVPSYSQLQSAISAVS
jgi:protein-disulfide isomerase